MLRTPPGEPSNTRQRHQTITSESSNSGITESTVTNPFIANAQSLSPFNRSRFARIQNNTPQSFIVVLQQLLDSYSTYNSS
ncbi:hypothetical protein F5890DRAFT_1560433 [Lentinula detonsa]|uniref:Uncharacterized protein n=1 Tax=Lentinula detonsa TaxID=2804962 RepID=A0AA38PMX3_9AGAR|nr:hypothetical protein F5890DRAFT_1560433 [Lentinula detonsa]